MIVSTMSLTVGPPTMQAAKRPEEESGNPADPDDDAGREAA
jgi:hypothetical protein